MFQAMTELKGGLCTLSVKIDAQEFIPGHPFTSFHICGAIHDSDGIHTVLGGTSAVAVASYNCYSAEEHHSSSPEQIKEISA